jgi:branched-chain amino acid transport system ATP-binding protein
MTLLEVRDAAVHYGPVRAVDGVSFEIEAGTVFGVIGPNGAGKSSLIDGLSGFTPLAAGDVRVRGTSVDRLAPHARVRLGLVRTWQSVELYEDLTIRENLLVVADTPHWWTMLVDAVHPGRRVPKQELVSELIDVLELGDVAERRASEVPQDRRKLAAIARALAADPAVVLLDEPAAGLTPEETAALGRRLRRMADQGLAILLIEHDMDLVMTLCDRVLVLDFGKPIAQGTPAEVVRDPRVIAAYLGGAVEQRAAATTKETA